MRGSDERTGSLFSYVDLEDRVPAKHPLRVIRRIVNDVLAALNGEFARIYADSGRPSIPPERLLRALIRSRGAKLFFLPKYSPDLNPIEQVFAKLKHLLRKAAVRTIETVCTTIGEILGAFTAEECANYFRNSGYQT